MKNRSRTAHLAIWRHAIRPVVINMAILPVIVNCVADDSHEDDYSAEDEYSTADEKPTCSCPYCFCMNDAWYGVCDDCCAGVHQG